MAGHHLGKRSCRGRHDRSIPCSDSASGDSGGLPEVKASTAAQRPGPLATPVSTQVPGVGPGGGDTEGQAAEG